MVQYIILLKLRYISLKGLSRRSLFSLSVSFHSFFLWYFFFYIFAFVLVHFCFIFLLCAVFLPHEVWKLNWTVSIQRFFSLFSSLFTILRLFQSIRENSVWNGTWIAECKMQFKTLLFFLFVFQIYIICLRCIMYMWCVNNIFEYFSKCSLFRAFYVFLSDIAWHCYWP